MLLYCPFCRHVPKHQCHLIARNTHVTAKTAVLKHYNHLKHCHMVAKLVKTEKNQINK